MASDHAITTGHSITTHDIATRALAGEPESSATLERCCDRLARALASVLNVLNPDAIVLGGGVSNIEHLYFRVPQLWTQYAFSDVITTKLLKAEHGDSSGVQGAAWLWG